MEQKSGGRNYNVDLADGLSGSKGLTWGDMAVLGHV